MDGATLRDLAVKVSQYFRDFLESDFKRQQAPRRRVSLQSESGFRSGMRTLPYPSLNQELWKLIQRPSGEDASIEISPRKYVRSISPVLRKIISEQVAALPESAFAAVRLAVTEKSTSTLGSALTDPEQWVEGVRTALADEIGANVVRPLIANLDGPLKAQAYSVIDSLYSAESDLIARVGADLDRVLADALAKYLATKSVLPVIEVTETYLTRENAQSSLNEFFDGFVAADAFLEFRDLETYVSTSDNLQLYLYIAAIKYRGNQYPIFFLPIDVERKKDSPGFSLKIVNHLYANRRAIDFVVQELSEGHNREWISPIKERISYLAPAQTVYEVARGLFDNVAIALDLAGQVTLSPTSPAASTASTSLSSEIFLAAYERSDEALINDFEEIIDQAKRGGSAIVDLFESMVKGIILENPVSITAAVDRSWDEQSLVDHLVVDTPIPLNEEQLKVLSAIRHPEGRIIVVEGPPGTGKSHTITAIAADCAQRGRSCLVLSDKKEALDVVQNKLAEAMSRVRHDKNFPNPILRLGQQNANFKQLTSNSTVSQVSSYAKAMKANKPALDAEHAQTKAGLARNISRTMETLGSISMADVQAFHKDESDLRALAPEILEVLERCTDTSLLPELRQLEGSIEVIESYLTSQFKQGDFTPTSLWTRLCRDSTITGFLEKHSASSFSLFESLDAGQVRTLSTTILEYRQLKMPILGYLLRGSKVTELERRINSFATTSPILLKTHANKLQDLISAANILRMGLEAAEVGEEFPASYSMIARGTEPTDGSLETHRAVAVLQRASQEAVAVMLAPETDDARLWPLSIRFLHRWIETRASFANAPQFDYVGTKSQLERLNTSMMNSHVDGRLVEFMENHRSDAKALAAVISNRQKFPEEKFDSLKGSFPVIIASIREFGEFMPLAPNLFDVVVIDEASQVSVAQALPALLRAKKIVVLGDSKQFSNVKSANASIAMNDKYRADLVQYFERSVSKDAAALQRLAMFDVKRSILEFCSLGASYSIMLRKHFRSYKELIGYSSGNFYRHQLQAIKIRGVALDEVVRFDLVTQPDGTATRGTNSAEAEFILERLLEFSDQESPPTVGIITPFREQQTLLTKKLLSHARGRDFEDKLRLKIMTFDSCQGEERNVIFYSMVATSGQDALQYIFPVDLQNADESVEQKLKVQRLNVGFSRAQEMVWFVHSMEIGEFRGSIGQALNYYVGVLRQRDVGPDQTDANSPMEAKVLDWLQNTAFIQSLGEEVEILPQFPIGDYLRQLDPTYRHPAWRVDFLVTVQTSKGAVHIVVEYDGLEYHFQPGREINVGNHERYLVEADVERQLTLESYGYRFLRINRFNLGNDPVQTLSMRLSRLLEVATGDPLPDMLSRVQGQAAGLASKELKPCSRCGEIKEQAAFFDPALKGGHGGVGRVCAQCKENDAAASEVPRYPRGRRRWR